MTKELVVLFEHPEWQLPLFEALDKVGMRYVAYDLKRAAFGADDDTPGRLYFNQASPSAYVRGNARAVPYTLAFLRHLETRGRRVLNGARAFELELSKTSQAALLRRLRVDHPHSVTFNDPAALRARSDLVWPAMLKPEQGGSGARMHVVESLNDLEQLLQRQPDIWLPDNLLLFQEYLPHDPERGIVRLEFLGGDLLYAMRVVTHGRFNLCPSEVCNPSPGAEAAEAMGCPTDVPAAAEAMGSPPDVPAGPPVEFYPFPEVPAEAVEIGRRIFRAAGLDVGGIEYLETPDGRRVFYDINANSNLRRPVAQAYGGFDPFDRVVAYLQEQLANAAAAA